MGKALAAAVFCAAMAGCGAPDVPDVPHHHIRVLDVLEYKGANGAEVRVVVHHDDARRVTCWEAYSGISCLPDATVAGGGK